MNEHRGSSKGFTEIQLVSFAKIIEKDHDTINKVVDPHFMLALLKQYPEFVNYLSDDKVIWINKYANPYSNIQDASTKDKCLLFAFTNFTNEFFARMHTLGMVGFLYQAVTEHGLKDTDCYVKEVSEEHKKEQEVIKKFLDNIFKYNPDKHIKDCYEAFKDKEINDEKRKFLCPEKVSKELETLPPKELLLNYERYYQFYFNEINGLTNRIFGLTSQIELAINPYMVGTLQEIDDFKKKYDDELRVPTSVVHMGSWTMIGPWRQNSKNVQFRVDPNSEEILDINRMMKSMDHTKFKEQMLKQKVDKIKKERPLTKDDEEAIRRYAQNMGTSDIVREALSTDPTPLNADEEGLQYDVIVSDIKNQTVDVGRLKLNDYVHT